MIINYTYEIINVDGKSMDVVYKSNEYGDFYAGVPLPSKGESVESVIEQYAPVAEWMDAGREAELVNAGVTGSGSLNTELPEPVDFTYERNAVLANFPVANLQNVEKVEAFPTEFLRINKIYNGKETLVGVHLSVSTELSTEEGASMFREGTKVIEYAKSLGVMVFVFSSNTNSIDYLVNTLGFEQTVLSDGSSVLNTPFTGDIVTAYNANVQPAYAKDRALEYPSIGDQLDALFHAGVFPADMAAQIQAIKDKYPKV